MMLFGFGRVPGCLGLGALFFVWVGRDEWRDERTVCQRGGCMVGPRCVGVSRWSYLAPGASAVQGAP